MCWGPHDMDPYATKPYVRVVAMVGDEQNLLRSYPVLTFYVRSPTFLLCRFCRIFFQCRLAGAPMRSVSRLRRADVCNSF